MPNDDDFLELLVDSAELEALDDASELDEDLDGDNDDTEDIDDPMPLDADEEDDDPVASALSPGAAPLFIVHKSHHHANLLPAVVGDINQRYTGALNVGVVAPMPRMSPAGLHAFLSRMAAAPLRFADPEAFARVDSFGPALAAQRDGKPFVGVSTKKHWSYFTDPQTGGYTASWVRDVLDAQRAAGATVLLTPGVWADPATAPASMATMRQHAEWARAELQPNEHLAVNVTLPWSWLTTPVLRNRLLDEVVDMDEVVFYMRVRWPLMGQAYGQLADKAILDGYVELANVFEENDKLLLLPNTGLTGWVSLACGAHGFSTGMGAGERAFADTRVIKFKKTTPLPAPTHRTFSSSILHVTDAATSDQLDALGRGPCGCRFCRTHRRLPAGQWDKGLAGAHYLRRVADLTASIATHNRGRRVAARLAVREAGKFVADGTKIVPLQGANDPKHLPVWASLLR
jgi:hypothetical protein